MTFPQDPISAATHPNPYPYYASLVAEKPLYYDEVLGLCVASSAKAVTTIMTNDLCRLRPTTEPIPKALLGSPAANIFRHLVRMNEGEGQRPLKQAVSATLTCVDAVQIAEHIRNWAQLVSAAVLHWRQLRAHRVAQARGRADIFADYRLRVASVIRDYGMFERAQAPSDSKQIHDTGVVF